MSEDSDKSDSKVWEEMDELEPSAEELAEAASLARAMDQGDDDGSVDDSVFAAASLIAYSEGANTLRDERAEAVLEGVLSTARRPKAPETAPARSWWRFLVPLPFAAAAAAAFFVMNTTAPLLPTPSMSLIEAQASAAAGEDRARLDEEMRDYRAELYAALEEGY